MLDFELQELKGACGSLMLDNLASKCDVSFVYFVSITNTKTKTQELLLVEVLFVIAGMLNSHFA